LTFAVNYAIGGLDVTSYHVTNLILHLLSAMALYGLVRRTLRVGRVPEAVRDDADAIALAAALLWVVHPLNSETVDYITERTEGLMGLCYLATLYASLRAATGGRRDLRVADVRPALRPLAGPRIRVFHAPSGARRPFLMLSAVPSSAQPRPGLASTEEIIEEIRRGHIVVLVDDEDRENEGDLIFAADFVTPEKINFMAKHGRGLICMPITADHARQLQLAPMTDNNRTVHGTNFTVAIEAAEGVTTGISAKDRAHTIRVASRPQANRRISCIPVASFRWWRPRAVR
jgi:hypothetical protein